MSTVLKSIASDVPSFEATFSPDRLIRIAEDHAKAYCRAEPFPHCVIDDFLQLDIAEKVLYEFPSPKEIDWIDFPGGTQKKLSQKDESEIRPFTKNLLYHFNSAPFIAFLERLTGIEGLVPDPYFWGGGLHQLVRGGFLKLHADFNFHPQLKLDRRINVLIYLNKDWDDSYGGKLELWDRHITKCEAEIAPIFNRCVVFNTTDFSFHGHPKPIACPEGMTRKSIALYYYSNGRPEGETERTRQTNWQMTPEEREIGKFKRAVGMVVPPIVFSARRAILKFFSGT